MSVKLIVMALLAATVTTVAGRGKVVTLAICPSSENCTCPTPKVTRYTVGECRKKDDEYVMVEDCTPGEGFSEYSFQNPDCNPTKWIYQDDGACHPVSFDGAQCKAGVISFLQSCSSNSCEYCSTVFSIASSDTSTCFYLKNKYYKLANPVDCTGSPTTIPFKTYTDSDCTEDEGNTEETMECIPKLYGKGTCDADGSKAITCVSGTSSCNSCDENELTFKQKKDFGGLQWYLDSCKADRDFTVTSKKPTVYPKACTNNNDGSSLKGTCAYMTATATATIPTTIPTGDANNSSADTSNSTGDANTSNSSEDNNNNALLAPAHSVGVLAFVLCVLACIY